MNILLDDKKKTSKIRNYFDSFWSQTTKTPYRVKISMKK